ncbi:hypothetical protein HYU94_01720 [Candidatus Daviesbacteria bacterium]|nr:hypothetical protein [Candidatus Daviesbacteria bacterium]
MASLRSFKIYSGKKILDYRLGEQLNLKEIRIFFQKEYIIKKIWSGPRHVLGVLAKEDKTYFLKLSTSEGISIVTKNEYHWNEYFNKHRPKDIPFNVPKNYDCGIYQDKYFYLITDYLNGIPLGNIAEYIPKIILFSEFIQNMSGTKSDYQEKFLKKARNWFSDIPADVRKKFNIFKLLEIVEKGVNNLSPKVRHGDFAPWHIIKLSDNKLGLIDGEHFLLNGVENYDICYFIQRVFSVLKNPKLAEDIYAKLSQRNYHSHKLQVVLAARAIGGFLDESLKNRPDYKLAEGFKDLVLKRVIR